MNMPMTRRIVLCALLAFAGLGAALAADLVLVEDWSKIPVGTTGIPPGWKGQDWGSPSYDLAVVEEDGQHVLRLRSHDDSSTIANEIKGKANLKDTPILEWAWKSTALPKGWNSCRKSTDAQPGQLFASVRRPHSLPSAVTDSREFTRDLEAENAAFWRERGVRIDPDAPPALRLQQIRYRMRQGVYNELRSVELLAAWIPHTPEAEIRQLLAGQLDDEHRHWQRPRAPGRAPGEEAHPHPPPPAGGRALRWLDPPPAPPT